MTRSRRARIALALAVSLVATLALVATALAAFGDRTLSRGMDGGDVEKLQEILTDLGYETPVTGHFGGLTEDNVKGYEGDEGRKVDGKVGPSQAEQMKAQAKEAVAERDYRYGERKLSRGDTGEDVGKLQRLLTKIGIETEVTEKFNGPTEESVIEDERKEGMRENGSVSPDHALDIERRAEEVERSGDDGGDGGADGRKHTFPILGPHDYGGSANRFGAPRGSRSHQGQDIFAQTGTPLVSVHDGKVTAAQYQASGAGHYVVIKGDDGQDSVYMHMVEPARVSPGQRVDVGDKIGKVACTGSCTGSHLHFELWTPHWYDGGSPFDPLHKLKHWDENS